MDPILQINFFLTSLYARIEAFWWVKNGQVTWRIVGGLSFETSYCIRCLNLFLYWRCFSLSVSGLMFTILQKTRETSGGERKRKRRPIPVNPISVRPQKLVVWWMNQLSWFRASEWRMVIWSNVLHPSTAACCVSSDLPLKLKNSSRNDESLLAKLLCFETLLLRITLCNTGRHSPVVEIAE